VRLTNLSGGTVLQVLYKPYGAEAIASGGATAKYRFTGQEKEDTGLYYYNARYYDPDLGRFIQADSVLDGLNRYAYCFSNPAMYVDPMGYDAVPKGTAISMRPESQTNSGRTQNAGSGQWVPVFEWGRSASNGRLVWVPTPIAPAQEGMGSTNDEMSQPDSSTNEAFDVGSAIVYAGATIHHGAESVAQYGWDNQLQAAHYGNVMSWLGGGILGVSGTLVAATVPETATDWALFAMMGPVAAGGRLEGEIEEAAVEVAATITGYTRHGLNRAISREGVGVSAQAILDTLRDPVRIVNQAKGAVKYVGKLATVVLSSSGRVIVAWARSRSGWRIRP
jgi:RHS repeat-associated protein